MPSSIVHQFRYIVLYPHLTLGRIHYPQVIYRYAPVPHGKACTEPQADGSPGRVSRVGSCAEPSRYIHECRECGEVKGHGRRLGKMKYPDYAYRAWKY